MTGHRRHPVWKWLALAAGLALVLRHVVQPHASRSPPGDFDEANFLRQARELAARERQIASAVLQHSQDDTLRTLARMSLAQHQAGDGVWVTLASPSEQAPAAPWPLQPGEDFDAHAAWAFQAVLDEAWPCFDLASQHAEDADLREAALRLMAWLEEAEQTLAPVLERHPEAVDR